MLQAGDGGPPATAGSPRSSSRFQTDSHLPLATAQVWVDGAGSTGLGRLV